jgi:hypothetical protein
MSFSKEVFRVFLIINKLDTPISQIYFGMKLYMFRTVPLSTIRSFSLYMQQWYICVCHTGLLTVCEQDQDGTDFHPDPARKLSTNLFDINHCCMYSEKLLMIDRGTARNM